MSDPQDLLYTNNFISTNLLTNQSLIDETKYYDRFTNFIQKKREKDTEKYIDDDLNEESQINLNKTLRNKWPVDYKKNNYPLFDTFINDVSTNRYKKEIVTKISIDSINRDISKFPNPNIFSITFPKVYNNIKKIMMSDINFPNINKSVTNIDNNLSWQYPSENFLKTYNIDTTIIPVPGDIEISFSSLPNSVYSYVSAYDEYIPSVDNYLVYQTNITPAYYDIETLIDNIRLSTSSVLHGQNELQTDIKIVEQPYLSAPKKIGNPHLFRTEINPVSSVVKFVNRIEELQIIALQTFGPYESNFKNIDVFYYYSSQYSPSTPIYTLNSNYIYLTILASPDTSYQYFNNLYCLNTSNPFPLVITGLKHGVGNISSDLINYTPFFDLNIYLNNGYTEEQLSSISYYKYIDTITIKQTTTINGNVVEVENVYLRFALSISTGTINGNIYNKNGKRIIPTNNENFFISNELYKFYQDLKLYTNFSYIDELSLVGRALLFRWIFDKIDNKYINFEVNTLNEKKRSLLKILAWPIANQTEQIFTVSINEGYSFVHANYHINITNKEGVTVYEEKENNYPILNLNIQNIGNKYYFVNNSYVYIKISFNTISDIETITNFDIAVSDENLLYNQIYVEPDRFNVGIGQDYSNIKNCGGLQILKKTQTGYFGKIMLGNIPGNYDILNSNIINFSSYVINYDNVKDNVNGITISLFDPFFRLLDISSEYSFSLDIHEIKDVLKETLINTKTNNVTSTGSFI